MKLCKDCKNFKKPILFSMDLFGKCHAPENTRNHPVSGKQTYLYSKYASSMRYIPGCCGISAKWFVPK